MVVGKVGYTRFDQLSSIVSLRVQVQMSQAVCEQQGCIFPMSAADSAPSVDSDSGFHWDCGAGDAGRDRDCDSSGERPEAYGF